MDAFCSPHASVDPKQQPKFIRKAEYLLALIQTQTNDALGIPGINYASAKSADSDISSFDLQKGTYNESGGTRTGTYFANPGGVFAQYYARSLNDIKLIGENEVSKRDKLYVASNGDGYLNGKTLANAFAASVGVDNISLFLQCVDAGVVSRDQLSSLKEGFRMKSFTGAEKERDLLIQLLLQEDFRASDEVTYYRKNTLLLFLEYIKNQPGEDHNVDFPKYVYQQYLKAPSEDPVYAGWYAYYLDDNYQYQASILLKNILGILNADPYKDLWVDLGALVHEMTVGITDILSSHGYSGTVEQVCSLLKEKELQWQQVSGAYPAMAEALLNLFYQTTVNESYFESIRDIQARYFAMSGMDDFSRFIQLCKEQAKWPLEDFISAFLEKQIIRKHFRVAMRKYHQTGIASYKFLLEDGYIRFLDGVEATHMDSRIDTVADFLRELELYNKDGLLPLGEECLELEGRL
ncbi:MAG: hypothetical protein J6X82_02450 [Bacteroidales bacterium]|nr:hypothetical protein [Bacteroidales bacterium]